ncbi:MAG: glutamine synthetase, partial [Cyanobacteria bacterium J06627_15]
PMSDGPSEDDPSLTPFPQTLAAALAALTADDEMQSMLGTEFCHLFSTVKAFELDRFHQHITDWEVAEYLEVY